MPEFTRSEWFTRAIIAVIGVAFYVVFCWWCFLSDWWWQRVVVMVVGLPMIAFVMTALWMAVMPENWR